MKKARKTFGLHLAALVLLLLFSGILTACQSSPEKPSLGIDGYVYLANKLSLPTDEYLKEDIRVHGGYVYYTLDSSLYRTSFSEELSFENGQLITGSSFGSSLAGYTLGDGGEIYYYTSNTELGKDYDTVFNGGSLVKLAQDGSEIYRLPLPDANIARNSNPCLAVDSEGRAFLLAEDSIYVADPQGELLSKISTDGHQPAEPQYGGRAQLLEGEEGRIYYAVTDRETRLYEITENGAFQLTERNELLKDKNGTFYGCREGLLCDSQDGILYQYSLKDNAWHEKLRWGDSNLPPGIYGIAPATTDQIIAYYSFYETNYRPAAFLLTKTSVDDLPEKEILVLATTDTWSNLAQDVAAFNLANDSYHIIIESYEGEGGLARLDSALASGNPPDLLDLKGVDLFKYVQKEVLEDLNLYLDNSTVLNRDDFLENLLDGYTIDGTLCCIPSEFAFDIVTGRVSQIGNQAGWTMEDVMAMTEKYPNARLLNKHNFEYALKRFCFHYILENYIDWESGTCSFDSTDFCNLIKWMQKHTGEIYFSNSEEDYQGDGFIPEDMLLVLMRVYSAEKYASNSFYWDSPIITPGFPSEDGRPLFSVPLSLVSNAIGIVSGGSNPDGAWKFLEYLLSEKEFDSSAFSSRKDYLYRAVEEETLPNYIRDENGEIIIYENFTSKGDNGQWEEHWNEPMVLPRMSLTIDGQEFYYDCMEQEKADALLEILQNLDFTPDKAIHSQILDIIMEEIAPYLAGDKTLEDAVQIIQNRVQTLVQEGL